MNKITKGALATGLGVALLLGGGGTLAVWNTTAEGEQDSSIVNGDLQLTAGKGTWTNAHGTVIDLATYKAVPGDALTFTQPVAVKLDGDLMEANLTVNKNLVAAAGSFLTVDQPILQKEDNTPVPTLLDENSDGNYKASVTVTFPSSTGGRDGVNVTNALGKVGFLLVQNASSTQPVA